MTTGRINQVALRVDCERHQAVPIHRQRTELPIHSGSTKLVFASLSHLGIDPPPASLLTSLHKREYLTFRQISTFGTALAALTGRSHTVYRLGVNRVNLSFTMQ